MNSSIVNSVDSDEIKRSTSSSKKRRFDSFDCNNNVLNKSNDFTLNNDKSSSYKSCLSNSDLQDKTDSSVNRNKLTCKSDISRKYNLRTKSIQNRIDIIKKQQQEKSSKETRAKQSKPKTRTSPLSRYRRKNANARERNRVQEINAAFEKLKEILPKNCVQQKTGDSKLTKIATLRNAAIYIKILSKLASQTNDDNLNCQTPTINQINSEDGLPDLSFISAIDLSDLLQIENEENQLPNQATTNSTSCKLNSNENETISNKSNETEYYSISNQSNLNQQQSYSQQQPQDYQSQQTLNQSIINTSNPSTSFHQNILCQTYTQNKCNFVQSSPIPNQQQIVNSTPLYNQNSFKLHSTPFSKFSPIETNNCNTSNIFGSNSAKFFSNLSSSSILNENLIIQPNANLGTNSNDSTIILNDFNNDNNDINNVTLNKTNHLNESVVKNLNRSFKLNDCSSDSLNDQSDSHLSIESDWSSSFYLTPELDFSLDAQDLF